MLTSDVANLANEKEELNNKMKEALDGESSVLFHDPVVSRMLPNPSS